MVDQTETSREWSFFQDQMKDVWKDLKDRGFDGVRNSFEDLVDRVQKVSGEKREQVREKLDKLIDRFNISFDA